MSATEGAVGVVVGSAAGDALGAPFEFGPALKTEFELTMCGGGVLGWEPGEWTDDSQCAVAVLDGLSRGLQGEALLAAIEEGLLAWMASGPRDVGNQTRAVLGGALSSGRGCGAVAAEYAARNPEAAGNGSLMRSGPVALSGLRGAELAELAGQISALTHAGVDCVEACVLWSDAIARGIDGGWNGQWIDWVSEGVQWLPAQHQSLWEERLSEVGRQECGAFFPNGWVVSALQAALGALCSAEDLEGAVEAAVRIGDDTDTVGAICGALGGAVWGAGEVPGRWRRVLHGRRTYDQAALGVEELAGLARQAWGWGSGRAGLVGRY